MMRSVSKFGLVALFAAVVAVSSIVACSPAVGSKEWCENMKKKDKGKWTADEATAFAKHCVF